MSLLLPRGKKWQKVKGQIKVKSENSIFLNCSKDWITVSTLIPFPLEENQNLEELFLSFIEFDLNSKKIQKIKVLACKKVRFSE